MSVMDSIKNDIENAWCDTKNYLPVSRERALLLKALDEAAALVERIDQNLSLTQSKKARRP